MKSIGYMLMQGCLRVQLFSQKQRKEKQLDVGTQNEVFWQREGYTSLKITVFSIKLYWKKNEHKGHRIRAAIPTLISVWHLPYSMYHGGQEGSGEWSATCSNLPYSLFLRRYIRKDAPCYTAPSPCPASHKSFKEQLNEQWIKTKRPRLEKNRIKDPQWAGN